MPRPSPLAPAVPEAPASPLAELATLLARGYIRSLARKVAPVAEYGPPDPAIDLDDSGDKSVHGGQLTQGDRP